MSLLSLIYRLLVASSALAFGLLAFRAVLTGELGIIGLLFAVTSLSAGFFTASPILVRP